MTSEPRPAGRDTAVAEGSTAPTLVAAEAVPAPAGVAPTPLGPMDGAQPAAALDPGTEQVPVPQDQAGIDVLRLEIDAVDAEIVRLIKRRSAISHAIGTARKSLGGPRIVYSREMAILERFRELGPAGTDLGMMLLAMGRGRLGRK